MRLNETVEVYNKDNEFLAIFTNVAPNETKNKINMMVNPEITNEQNVPSIFTFSINTKSQKWKDINNIENIYIVDGKHYTALNENAFSFDGDSVYANLIETQILLSKQYIQAYNTPKVRENIDEHTVVLLPKSTEPLIINGIEVNNPYPRGSAGYNLYALLYPTEWNLGICDVLVDGFNPSEDFGVFNVETDQKDILHNINLVKELYGGILVWHSDTKTVDLRDENKWDTDFGFEIRQGKNLKKLPVIAQNNDIITRIIPLGTNKLSIKLVNDNKLYLDNFSYTNKIYSRIVENPNIYDQKQLKFWAERELAKMCKPRRLITAEMIDRRQERSFEHDFFNLNDIATIVYKNSETGLETSEQQRIIKWQYKVFTPYNCTVECGNKQKNVMEILKQTFNMASNSDNIINDNGTIGGNNIDISGNDQFKNFWQQYLKFEVNTETEFVKTHASIELLADETQAKITLLTEYTDKEFIKTQTSITQLSNKTEASITSLTNYTNSEFSKTNTSIKQLSNATEASITSLTNYTNNKFVETQTSITQLSNSTQASINLHASYIDSNSRNIASVSITANNNTSRIDLVAREISFVADDVRIVANTVNIQGNLIATKANLSYVTSEFTNTKNLIAGKASFGYVDSQITNTKQLIANKASINELRAIDSRVDSIFSGNAVINSLSVGTLTVAGTTMVYSSTSVVTAINWSTKKDTSVVIKFLGIKYV